MFDMRNRQLIVTCLLVVFGTTGSGWLHGRLINRWGNAQVLEQAAERLDQALPRQLGPWRLVQSPAMKPGALEILQSVGHLQGGYSNDQTGESIVIQLVGGPSGPMSAHTPEICYAGHEYRMAGERKRTTVVDQSGREHSFWQLHALAQHIRRPDLEVLYGWSDGGAWDATNGPRIAFGGLPVLYKLQLARGTSSAAVERDTDPTQEFLSRFLVHVEPLLVKSSRLSRIAR